MSKSKIVLLFVANVLVIVLVCWLFTHCSNKKLAVVDVVKLFNAYTMKQELEQRDSLLLTNKAKELDSFKSMVEANASNMNNEQMQQANIKYYQMQQGLEELFQQSNESINKQVWEKLNPAIDVYGADNHYRLILGANGMGSILYNTDYYEITDELIEYVNKAYEQGN